MAKNDTPASGSSQNNPLEARTNQELIDAAGATGEGDAAIEAIEKNKNLIIILILAGVVIFAAVLVMKHNARNANIEAGEAFSSAVADGSIEKLSAVAAEYEGTNSGGNALLMKAEKQLEAEKAQDAKMTLENFVSKYSDHPRHQQGSFALGTILHEAGDLEAARTQYELALGEDEVSEIAPLIKIKIADTWLEGGDSEKARQLYEVIPSEHPGSVYIDRAEQKLELAEIGEIEVVAAPQPEPEPEPQAAPAPASEPVAIPKPAPKEAVAAPASEKPKGNGKPKAAQKGENKGKAKAKAKGDDKPKGEKGQKGAKADQPKPAAPKTPAADQPAKPKPSPKPAAKPAKPEVKAPVEATPAPAESASSPAPAAE